MNTSENKYVESGQSKYGSNRIIQANLQVGEANNPLEMEADAIADQVMRMPNNGLIQRKCSQCDEEEKAMRKPLTSFIQKKGTQGGLVASDAVSNQINSLKGTGNRLSGSTKGFMESSFGTDFSNVGIHTGGEAAQMNRELNAKAFTVGNDIYFNSGQYTPDTSEGKRLLAHELTHTVQQTSNIQRQQQPQQPTPGFHPDANIDLQNAELVLTYAIRALGNIQLSGGLTEPLNLITEATGTPLGLPQSTLDFSLAYSDRCNRALQSFFARVQQQQPDGGSVFNFSNADWSASVGGGVRMGDLLVNAGGTASFNGNEFQALTFALTFTRGVDQAIPTECLPTPTTTGPNSDPSMGNTPGLCEGIDCDRPATIENASQHLICCIGTPEPHETPITPQVSARTIYFFYDTPIFKEESNAILAQVFNMMQTFSSMHVQISGHTSIEGSEEYNQGLSERRAQAVHTYLVMHGIDSSRIQLFPMGENAPTVGEPSEPTSQLLRLPANEAIRDLNRRAEVVFFDPSGTLEYLPSSPPMTLTVPDRSLLRLRVE